MHGRSKRHAPCATARTHRFQQSGMDPQPSQRALPSGSRVPPNPEALPNVPSNPRLQPEDRPAHFSQSEIAPPAAYVSRPGISQLIAGSTLVAAPHLPHLPLESFDTLRRYSDPPFAIQSKAQELAFPNPPGSALGGIHLQSQMLLNPGLDRCQRPFRRRLTAYVDIAVIGISAECVPSPLQFLVERVQIDVSQQWR
jgi:hypothetical protein